MDFNQFSEVATWSDLQKEVFDQLTDALIKMAEDHGSEFGWLNVIVLPSEDHKDLNNKYLQHDYATDVLTFSFDDEEEKVSGEVYLDAEVVPENAEAYGVSIQEEYMRMVIHGALHLLGFDDGTEEEREVMRKKEDHYLKKA